MAEYRLQSTGVCRVGARRVGIERDLEKLLAGEELRYPILDTITFGDIGRDPENIWSFLYYAGYLKANDPRMMR